MAAYLVLMQEVHDVDRYRNEYLPGWRPFLKRHGAEVLVPGFDAEPAEGEPPNSSVVLRFADAAAAGPATLSRRRRSCGHYRIRRTRCNCR